MRRDAGRLRIATELSDAETGTIIRSDKYEGVLDDLFTLQDRISASVVGTIAPHVLEHELVRARRKHPQNMTAYDFLLQALDQLYRMDDELQARARGLLQQAMAQDPFNGPAYSRRPSVHFPYRRRSFDRCRGGCARGRAAGRHGDRIERERPTGTGDLRPCAIVPVA